MKVIQAMVTFKWNKLNSKFAMVGGGVEKEKSLKRIYSFY